MRPTVELRDINVDAGEEGSGVLVLIDNWLVAVLVRLSDHHGHLSGHWFLETGYGRFSDGDQPVFPTLPLAEDWFASHLADRSIFDQSRRR